VDEYQNLILKEDGTSNSDGKLNLIIYFIPIIRTPDGCSMEKRRVGTGGDRLQNAFKEFLPIMEQNKSYEAIAKALPANTGTDRRSWYGTGLDNQACLQPNLPGYLFTWTAWKQTLN